MAFQDASRSQLASLSREIATLTASLQREKQRRAAIAAHAKDMEHRANECEKKLCQVQYANKKLEEELNQAKQTSEEKYAHEFGSKHQDGENASLRGEVTRLKFELARAVSRQQELERQRDEAVAATPPVADPPTTQQQEVDAAVQELQAIVPQYRASIAALQGRMAVLNKQLEKTTAERDELQIEATRWREMAKRNEASFAGAAAKLHSQEAASIAAVTSSQAAAARLEGEVSALRQRCFVAESEAQEARSAAQQAQHALDSQSKLLEAQSDTISRLESTIREQQEDIIAALDLVCHRSATPGIDPGFTPQHAPHAAHEHVTAKEHNTAWENLDFNRDDVPNLPSFKAATGGGTTTSRAAAADPAASAFPLSDWSIPAEHTTTTNNKRTSNPYGYTADTTFESSTYGGATSSVLERMTKETAGGFGKAGLKKGGGMAELAEDIAALRDALKHVM